MLPTCGGHHAVALNSGLKGRNDPLADVLTGLLR